MATIEEESLALHRKIRGKLEICGKAKIRTTKDLALLYTPGVAEACREIVRKPESVYDLTIKHNSVAIVTDGSRVLGLGDIGAEAALPVMEGKALIMKEFADIDAFPIALATRDEGKIVDTIKNIAPAFGAINLEDIETPKVFEIEKRLEDELHIPVFHDDQHGTAVVVLAALHNALKATGRKMRETKIVVVGAGSAGYGIAKLIANAGAEVVGFDRVGALGLHRKNLPAYKQELVSITNKEGYEGAIKDFRGADVIISAAVPGAIPFETINAMNGQKIVFALSNPLPEISLEDSKKLGISIFGTGRSDYPNQINNSLCFPGFLRALLDMRVRKISNNMKIAAAHGIASMVSEADLRKGMIVPDALDKRIVESIRKHIEKAVN